MAADELLILAERDRDPRENLAREEELFQQLERREVPQLVRFWIDSECLVRGKARSANYGWYREELARELGIEVVQRGTGGGVVYHDAGNLNWSFFLKARGAFEAPSEMFSKASGYVIGALDRLGVAAQFSRPNRIDVDGHKVSGMAARSTPKTILVHGTLLLDSDLDRLNLLCVPPVGCPPVANLKDWVAGIEAVDVVSALADVMKDAGFGVKTSGELTDGREG